MEELEETDYKALVTEIKTHIRDAQYRALRAVNKELIDLYWNIGGLIVGRQQGATWGQSVVRKLAADVQSEFPRVQGFSPTNMWRMKLFYENHSGSQKVAPLVRLIGWSHNVIFVVVFTVVASFFHDLSCVAWRLTTQPQHLLQS